MGFLTSFFLFNIITLAIMKALGNITSQRENHLGQASWFSLSPTTRIQTPTKFTLVKLIIKYFLFHIIFVLSYKGYPLLLSMIDSKLLQSYALVPFVYLFTIILGLNVQGVSLIFSSKAPVDIHNNPLISRSLFEFWSLRWNVWIKDWLRVVGKYFFPRSLWRRQIGIFLVSGLFHEFMLNIPYYLSSDKNLIGTMLLYFLIQFFGLILDKQLKVTGNNTLRYCLMWITLIIPAPLFINAAFFNLFGF